MFPMMMKLPTFIWGYFTWGTIIRTVLATLCCTTWGDDLEDGVKEGWSGDESAAASGV
eukprot:m.217949 g.217949  ORF g.217949 m.217949 type:complete len:58 (-) comp25697_c2_seq20:1261-1434(-)